MILEDHPTDISVITVEPGAQTGSQEEGLFHQRFWKGQQDFHGQVLVTEWSRWVVPMLNPEENGWFVKMERFRAFSCRFTREGNAPERVLFPQVRSDGEHENIEEKGGMGVLQAGLSLTDLTGKRCRKPERNPIPHARWIEKKTTGRTNPDRDPRFAAVCTDTKRLASA